MTSIKMLPQIPYISVIVNLDAYSFQIDEGYILCMYKYIFTLLNSNNTNYKTLIYIIYHIKIIHIIYNIFEYNIFYIIYYY